MSEDFRCAAWTLAEGIDPAGSAVRVDRLVLVELPLPWPGKIEEADWLAGHVAAPETRLQAIVPESPRLDGRVLLTVWERHGARFAGTDVLVDAPDVRAAVGALSDGRLPPAGETAEAPAEILVCGHGSRDRCCGGAGTRLAVEAQGALPRLRVRRTSHLGGHRFAPTALVLPEGRAWAHLDAASLVGIAEHTLDPAEARTRYRGHIGLDPWAQVVEADRLVQDGWAAAEVDDLTGEIHEDDGEQATVTLTWAAGDVTGERTAQVVVRRRYPVLQCGLSPEEATKTATEYAIAEPVEVAVEVAGGGPGDLSDE